MSAAHSWDAHRARHPRVTRMHVLGVASMVRAEQGRPGAPDERHALPDTWIAAHPREWAVVTGLRLDELVDVVNRIGFSTIA